MSSTKSKLRLDGAGNCGERRQPKKPDASFDFNCDC